MTAQPGERTVSWLDEDDPNRGSVPFVPVESVIELTPSGDEPPPPKKSRREKAPKPPKPPRGKLWRRQKATQEKPPRENPAPDVTPRAEDWPAPASEDWLTTLRRPEPRQEWAAARDTKPRDAEPPREWTANPDDALRNTGPHPAWAAAPEGVLDDDDGDWTTTPPAPEATPAPAPAPAETSRGDWFNPVDTPTPDGADRPEWNGTPEPASREEWGGDRNPPAAEAPARPDPVTSPEPATRPEWAATPAPDRRSTWDDDPQPRDPRSGWDGAPEPPAPRSSWDDRSSEGDPRDGWDDRSGKGDSRDSWDDRSNEGDSRDSWDDRSNEGDSRDSWDDRSREGDPRDGWSDRDERRGGWDDRPAPAERRVGWAGDAEQKARPDWLASPLPPAAPAATPEDGWSAAEPRDTPVPEAWPAPLDITPDDDLDELPAKRRRTPRRTPRPSGPPTGGRPGRRPRSRRKPLMVLAVALTAAVVGAAVVAAGSIYRLVFDGGTPGLHTIAAPLGGRTKGELQLASGAEIVTVVGADLGDDLFQITTPDSDDAIPRATIRGDLTTVRLTSNSGEGARAVEVRLHSRVTWRLVFTGGARTQTIDFSGGRLSGLEMTGGATKLELILPKPAGTVPIRLRSGLNELLMHAPRGVHTRVKVTKGATNLTLDRFNRSKVAPDTTFTPDGWGQAKARYDVDAAEGIGTVKLDRR